MPRARALCLIAFALAVACRSEGPGTAPELRTAIERYRTEDADVSEQRVEALFARLDADIAALRADAEEATGAERETLLRRAESLEAERLVLRREWAEVRVARLGTAAGDAARAVGEAVGRGLEDAGKKIQDAVRHPPATPAD